MQKSTQSTGPESSPETTPDKATSNGPSYSTTEWSKGYKSGQEDHAIGAGWEWPSDTLSEQYRQGYYAGYHDAALDDLIFSDPPFSHDQ